MKTLLTKALKIREYPLAILLLGGLAVRLILAWLSIEILIQKAVSDDAYYYFVVTRNMAKGLGPTIDGTTLTNGFHPLWAALLVPFFALLPSQSDWPIHFSLTLAAFLDVAAAWLGYAIVHAATRDIKAALVTCALYVFNPRTILEAVNGLETSLNLFLLALCFYWYERRVSHRPDACPSDYLLLGVLGGLMVLARTDSIFFFAIILTAMLFQARSTGLFSLFSCGLAFALTLSPWLIWSQQTFGTMIQSSGVAVSYLIQQHIPGVLVDRDLFALLYNLVFLPSVGFTLYLFWQYSGVAWIVALVSLIGLRLARLWTTKEKPAVPLPKSLALLVVASGVVIGFHSFYRWYPRSWYYVPLAFVASLLAGPMFARASRAMPPKLGSLFEKLVVGGTALILLAQGVQTWKGGFYPWQTEMYQGAQWLTEHTRAEDIIGAFNGGLYAYYSQRTVVTLDGVTNWDAFRAIRRRQLFNYIDERNIAYIIDYQEYIVDTYGHYYGAGYPERFELLTILPTSDPEIRTLAVYQMESE